MTLEDEELNKAKQEYAAALSKLVADKKDVIGYAFAINGVIRTAMKATRHEDLFTWNVYQPDRRIDFNGFYWRRPGGGVLIDPMPLSRGQLEWLAEQPAAVCFVILTNADHLRAGLELRDQFGARLIAPRCDRELLPRGIDGWYDESTALPPELDISAHWVHGGKTEAEAVLHIPELDALLFGDIVRSHESGVLRLLPGPKIQDEARVAKDLRDLAVLSFSCVLLGDGDSLFTGARVAFDDLLATLPPG